MKKITVWLIAIALVGVISSCKKEDQDSIITKTIGISLAAGETYTTHVVYKGDDNGVLMIVKQAEHAEVSELTPIAGSRDATFTYKPVSNYTGTDEVRISSESDAGNGNAGGHGHGEECHGNDRTTVYVYKFTLTGDDH